VTDLSAEGPTLLAETGPEVGEGERLTAGAKAGDYEVEGFLGAGAMGDVYAGKHPLIGKRVAIKVIKRRLASSPEAVERFLREARAVNQVGHANVVDIFAVGRLDDGRLYLVMDLLDGESLGARLRRDRMPPEDTVRILDAVAVALDAAHDKRVVHRDLKPDNVFLAERGVFVLDFGIAKLLTAATAAGAPGPGTLTDRGTWLGTPAYMAPEQWGADGAGPASDRYALGVMAFEMLAGRAPFSASSLPGMMEQHFRAPVPTVTGQAAALPAAVDDVLARAMAKDPDHRFPTAVAMVDALRAAVGSTGRPRPARRASPMFAILGVATAGAAVVTAVVVLRGGRDRQAAGQTTPTPTPSETVAITSSPAGARILLDGAARGVTPTTVPRPERAVTLVVDKPGYTRVTRTLAPDGVPVRVTLSPVTLFEGVWALPDGVLRGFERRGEQVAMFSLEAAQGERHFERVFEFVAADAGLVAWVAAEDHVDPRAPDEPSCHVPLQAEYAYDVTTDGLERRTERVQLDFEGGHCAVVVKEWGETITLRRLDVAEHGTWAESSAGAGNPTATVNSVDAPPPRDPGDDKGIPRDAKDAPFDKKKAPPAKKKPTSKQPAINPQAQTGDAPGERLDEDVQLQGQAADKK